MFEEGDALAGNKNFMLREVVSPIVILHCADVNQALILDSDL